MVKGLYPKLCSFRISRKVNNLFPNHQMLSDIALKKQGNFVVRNIVTRFFANRHSLIT